MTATVVVTSALAVVINLATDWKTNPWAWLGVVAVTVLAGVVALWTGNIEPDPGRVADLLAIAVSDEWHSEAKRRYLDDPYPILVRWGPSDPALVADWTSLVKLATSGGWPAPSVDAWADGPSGLTGSDSDLVDVLGRVPTGRLVVLGKPGAGKTFLLVRLMLDLHLRRHPGAAVPVLLSLASWNPAQQDLRSWIVRQLITDHGMGRSEAQTLSTAGLILPVLDGLDEIPDAVRGSAIAQINDSMRSGESLVLAAREDEYRATVCPPEGVEVHLRGAAGITLCPLDVRDVSDYLRASARRATAAARWDEVLSSFTADSPPPVARALSTPLMVTLARAIYNPRSAEESLLDIPEPAELLDPKRFGTREDVEKYLFDMFVPAAYRPHPDPRRRCKWTADQAVRWLVFLACDLEHRQSGTTNLAWWKLSRAAPRPLAGIGVGLIAGLAGGLGLPFPMDLGVGFISASAAAFLVRTWLRPGPIDPRKGLLGGLFGGLLSALGALAAFGAGGGNTSVGSYLPLAIGLSLAVAPWGRFRAGFVGAFMGGFLAAFSRHAAIVGEIGATTGPMAWLVNGLGLGLVTGLAVGLSDRNAPERARWSPVGFVCGLACGLVMGLVVWIQVGSSGGLVVGLASMLVAGYAGGLLLDATPTDPTKAASVQAVLVRDRATFRSSCIGFGLAVGLSTGLWIGIIDGAPNGFRVGLANLVTAGLCFGFRQALWGSFTLARWWLAASHRLPWRLMTFLADAHEKREVFRQAGASYQFRHTELQRRLARQRARRVVLNEVDDASLCSNCGTQVEVHHNVRPDPQEALDKGITG